MFPVLFAIPRTAGWVAQWEEMLLDPEQKIARPRQIYIGAAAARLRSARQARLTVHASVRALRSIGALVVRCRIARESRRCARCVDRRERRTSARSARQSTFDSAKAWEHLRQQVAIGPRPSGSPAHRRDARLHHRAAEGAPASTATRAAVRSAQTPLGPVTMVNLIATIPGKRPERIVLASHFDTKLFREFRFVGANDGASSTAALLELARVLKARPNAVHDRAALPRRRRSGRAGLARHRQHLRQPPLRGGRAEGRVARRSLQGARPARHDRRPRPAPSGATRTPRRWLDRHHLGARRASWATPARSRTS